MGSVIGGRSFCMHPKIRKMNKTISLSVAITVMVLAWSANMNVKAQSLTFSQVLLVESSAQTVPPGKVWKVVSCMGDATTSVNYTAGNVTFPPRHYIVMNGSNIAVIANIEVSGTGMLYSGGTYYKWWTMMETCTTMPIWLPESTTLAAGSNVTAISVIEFSVVP
jgi:hypothetical protein